MSVGQQFFDGISIPRWKRQLRQKRNGNPGERCRDRVFDVDCPAAEERQVDSPVIVRRHGVIEQTDDVDSETGLFQAFSNCARGRRFTWIAFAPGEFCHAAQVHTGRPSTDEDPVALDNNSHADSRVIR